MSFANVQTNTSPKTTVRKLQYMALTPGAHRLRILDTEALSVKTHFLNNSSVKCLDDDCPICANNKKIIMQFPDTFREQSGYNRYSVRFFVNVLDRTPAKVCPDCGKEYKNLAATICTCGKVLGEVAPLNKVKILSKGSGLFGDLDNIDKSIMKDNGEPVGITNYDINIIVNGSGRDVKYTAIPDTSKNDVIALSEELFDLSKAVLTLSPDEMLDVQRGVTIKDIFASRRTAEKKQADDVAVAVPDVVLKDVDDAVKALFGG